MYTSLRNISPDIHTDFKLTKQQQFVSSDSLVCSLVWTWDYLRLKVGNKAKQHQQHKAINSLENMQVYYVQVLMQKWVLKRDI